MTHSSNFVCANNHSSIAEKGISAMGNPLWERLHPDTPCYLLTIEICQNGDRISSRYQLKAREISYFLDRDTNECVIECWAIYRDDPMYQGISIDGYILVEYTGEFFELNHKYFNEYLLPTNHLVYQG